MPMPIGDTPFERLMNLDANVCKNSDVLIVNRQDLKWIIAALNEAYTMREAIDDEIKYQMEKQDNVNGGLMMAVRPWDKLHRLNPSALGDRSK